MAKNVQKIAELMGGKIVGQVPDVGGGAFGAARLAKIYQARMEQLRRQEVVGSPGADRPRHLEIPVSQGTLETLTELARRVSTPDLAISPMEVASQLLEEAVARYSEEHP